LLSYAKERGIERVVLDTTELQETARRLYVKNGFAEYNRRKWNDIDVIYYEKFL